MIGGTELKDVGKSMTMLLVKAKQKAEKNGIDLTNLPSREELERRTIKEAHEKLEHQNKIAWESQSLWPSNIPLKFSFENWKPNMQSNTTEARELGKKAFLLTKELANTNFNVALVGAPGVGKTSLALAMMDKLSHIGKSVLFISTAELVSLMDIKKEFKDVPGHLRRIEIAMKGIDVLLLDDFGTEGSMTFNNYGVRSDMQRLMYRVANARCDFNTNQIRGITITTTNNTQDELQKMYDTKIISRLIPDPKKAAEHRIAFSNMQDVRGV